MNSRVSIGPAIKGEDEGLPSGTDLSLLPLNHAAAALRHPAQSCPSSLLASSVMLSAEQLAKLGRLEIIKGSVAAFCVKQDEQRVFQLLTAASKGEAEVRG